MTERGQAGRPQDDVVVLPPVAVDPVFAEAVDDALAGPQVPTSPHDPARELGADPHDFAGLYIRHRHSFGLHARRFLRDQRDVDEVVQEAFLRLFLALPELGTELQALSYCRRTITNLCIDRYRADQRRPRLIDLESVPADVLGEDELDDPVIQAEDAALVREALALLSPLHREALVKREIEEKPLPVIAAELGVPEDSVKHLLHRARRALRRRLAETHLAPGVDLDDVSTLSLLARSAVSGAGGLGVFLVLLVGLVLGATTRVPVQAFETISGLWRGERLPAAAPALPTTAGVPRAEVASGANQPAGVLGLERDLPGPAALPPQPAEPREPRAEPNQAPAVEPAAVAAATGTVTTSPSPSTAPSASPAAPVTSPAPLPRPSELPVVPPSEPTASASPDPTRSPTASAPPDEEPGAVASADPAPTSASAGGQPRGGTSENGPVRTPVSALHAG